MSGPIRRFYSVSEFSRLIDISGQTIGQWVKNGVIKSYSCSKSQSKYIDITDDSVFLKIRRIIGERLAVALRYPWPPSPSLMEYPESYSFSREDKAKRILSEPLPRRRGGTDKVYHSSYPPRDLDDILAVEKDAPVQKKKKQEKPTVASVTVSLSERNDDIEYEAEDYENIPEIDSIQVPVDIRRLPKDTIEKIHIYYKALKERIKGEEARGKLVPRKAAARICSDIWSAHRSQLIPMNHRLAVDICSNLEIDDPKMVNKVSGIIEQETYAVLGAIKTVLTKGLASIDWSIGDDDLTALEEDDE